MKGLIDRYVILVSYLLKALYGLIYFGDKYDRKLVLRNDMIENYVDILLWIIDATTICNLHLTIHLYIQATTPLCHAMFPNTWVLYPGNIDKMYSWMSPSSFSVSSMVGCFKLNVLKTPQIIRFTAPNWIHRINILYL